MALDVHLMRDQDEPWGFELVGGADEEMPLTIEKIEPDSPAKRAGLLNGDTILTINREEAIDLSLEAACRRIEKSSDSLIVGVVRGLYDPVLDDQEPIYDYEPEDLDRQSEPTEVSFKIQQFIEPSDLGSNLLDYGTSPLLSNGINVPLSESRSLTASPFLTPTKPYRPFSTEPVLEVPPIEDPIILNPNYRDEFGKSPINFDPDYLLSAFYKNGLECEGRYKLPISEQYDPDGKRFVQNVEVVDKLLKYEKHVKSLSKDLNVVDVTKESKVFETTSDDVKKNFATDLKSKETISNDYLNEDIKIEKTGDKICEETISKEMKYEESIKESVRTKEKRAIFKEEIEQKSTQDELKYIEKNDLESIEETALSVVDDSIERAVSVAEEIKKEIEQELISSQTELTFKKESEADIERKVETWENREEEIVDLGKTSQKVKRKNVNALKEEKFENVAQEENRTTVEKKTLVIENNEHEKIIEKPGRKESLGHGMYETKFENFNATQNDRKEAGHRAYNIGLQTIPNIRGIVHSSYHYDLLLRTFFIHLTDVMVALSRFVLTQPIFNQSTAGTQETVTTTHSYESGTKNAKQETKLHTKQEVKVETVKGIQEQKLEKSSEGKKVSVEKKSGAEMAQLSERKLSRDLTQKMDAVISEFQTIAVEEHVQKEVFQRDRRSRSRSQIEEEVMKESDPLEWLSKVDSRKASQERTNAHERDFSSTETMEKRSEMESTHETRHTKTKSPKNTYIAIVEAHVYTNKDAIFKETTADISETASIQSAEDINTAIEVIEALSTENVAIESAIKELETARVVEESHELATVTAKSAATVQKIEEETHESKEFSQEEYKIETAMKSNEIQEVLVQEIQDIIEPVVEIKENNIGKDEKVAVKINEALSIAESTIEVIEALGTEHVRIESATKQLETAKGVAESHELATVTAKSAATVQNIKEETHESKEFIQEEYKIETAMKSNEIQEGLVQEIQDIIEPVVEIKENNIGKVEKVAVNINESLSTAESTEINVQESKSEISNVEMNKETVAIVEEEKTSEKVIEFKAEVVEPKPVETVEITATVVLKPGKKDQVHDEFAALKIIKKVDTDVLLSPEIIEIEDISELALISVINKTGNELGIEESKHVSQNSYVSSGINKVTSEQASHEKSLVNISQASQISSEIDVSSATKASEVSKKFESEHQISETLDQVPSFMDKYIDRKLSLRTDINRQTSLESPPSSIATPSPSTVPPTPLTDEYVFKLKLPLPKSRSATPVPRDCTLSPEDEDPHIVKKGLIPHIETTIERVVYDPPLPTPPADKVQSLVYSKPGLNGGENNSRYPIYIKPGLYGGGVKVRLPVYRKPGLFGGADRPEHSKEEIREIERKSSLLASAIDETIKSIEEYKEEVGIESKKEVEVQAFKEDKVSKSHHKSHSKTVTIESKQNGFDKIETSIETIIEQCDNALAGIDKAESNNISIEEVNGNQRVSEVTDIEIKNKKASDSQNESEVKMAREKAVKFENEFRDVENGIIEAKDEAAEIKTRERVTNPILTNGEAVDTVYTINAKHIEDVTIDKSRTSSESKVEMKNEAKTEEKTEKCDALLGFRPVVFDPEAIQKQGSQHLMIQEPTGTQESRQSPYMTESGELIGTIQGIVDGLEDPVMDEEVAKELGKPGIPDEKIAVLISGEAEMLREAHVMGLARVLTSHMHRADDSSVDFQKIKPMLGSLKDSEVLKALNEELARQKAEEKKKEEKRWTTFLQKPSRPPPKAKFGYQGWTQDEEVVAEPYKVKIVKQAKPKVAPDYKPEDFETGPLPWEERAVTEASLPPVEPEEPILIPEVPEFLEAVDPLKESEVPDLEDTGIPLPPPREPTPPPAIEEQAPETQSEIQEVQEVPEEVVEVEEKKETIEDMDNRLAEQLVRSVQGMVDPNASIDQQLSQMRAQLAALAQLPEVIQQSLELVSRQLSKMNHQDQASHTESQNYQQVEVSQNHTGSEMQTIQEANENNNEGSNDTEVHQNEPKAKENKMAIEEVVDNKIEMGQNNMPQGQENMRMTTPGVTEEEIKTEKQKKEQARLEYESRQIKHNPTPRACKPKRVFGPLDPEERVKVVLPGGRRWRNTQDVYNEQLIAETLQAQSELLNGKTMGVEWKLNFVLKELPQDSRHARVCSVELFNRHPKEGGLKFICRINFMKYEKPPVTLDHLKHSEVYKLVHDMDQTPLKRVEMSTPVMCEADYRERCRSMTPSVASKHLQIPQQFHP